MSTVMVYIYVTMEWDRHDFSPLRGFGGHMVRCLGFVRLQGSVSNLIVMDPARMDEDKSCFRGGGDLSITWMELLPIVLSCLVWKVALRGQRVTVYCDNSGAVVVVNSGFGRVHSNMHLLWCLFFIRAH